MKKKIEEALKREYASRYGLKDEDWSDIASNGAELVTTEEQIPAFVKGAETMVKRIQQMSDKIRTYEKRDNDPKPVPAPEPKPAANDEIKALLEEIRKERSENQTVIESLKNELSTMRKEKETEDVVRRAKVLYENNKAVLDEKFKNEGADAWERAVEIFEATGSSLTAEQLSEKAVSYFNKAASRIGYDPAKYVPGSGEGNEKDELDTYLAARRKKAEASAQSDKALRESYGLNDE